jgi:uncharacterized protein YaaR (DUF327 family)
MTPLEITSTLNQIVSYRNVLYKFVSAIIRKNDKGEIFYLAEIKDLNANSVCFVKLEDVDNG